MNTANAALSRRRILLVDDDDALRDALREQIQLHEEFESVEARLGLEAIEKGRSEEFDLVLLDVGLPDMDGRDVRRLLRRNGMTCPIIMLTDAYTTPGLDPEAEDYITKPFRLGVLMAFMYAQLRQEAQSEDAPFNIGPYSFQPGNKLLIKKETQQKIRLTEKETAILKFLYRKGAHVVSRDILLNEVWKYNTSVTTHTLETHIYRLRQKIEPDPSKASLLVTESGGYRLAP